MLIFVLLEKRGRSPLRGFACGVDAVYFYQKATRGYKGP
jgi:hypothetical protein